MKRFLVRFGPEPLPSQRYDSLDHEAQSISCSSGRADPIRAHRVVSPDEEEHDQGQEVSADDVSPTRRSSHQYSQRVIEHAKERTIASPP